MQPAFMPRSDRDPRQESRGQSQRRHADVERLTRMLERCERLSDPTERALVSETIAALVGVFGDALGRVLQHADATSGGGPPLRERLRGDAELGELIGLLEPQPGPEPPRVEGRPLQATADPGLVQIGSRDVAAVPVAGRAGQLRCEWCGEALPAEHDHVADLDRRSLRCACRACTLLFDRPGAGGGRYRSVRRRTGDARTTITVADWTSLGIPVGLAFVFHDSTRGRWVALYPSPGGPIEAEIHGSTWERLRGASPVLASAEPDVEAVAVHAERGAAVLNARVVPITDCYSLIGEVRTKWQGFEGGDGVRRAIAAFFESSARPSHSIGVTHGGEQP